MFRGLSEEQLQSILGDDAARIDNGPCCALLGSPPNGIFHLLDTCCRVHAAPANFCLQVHEAHLHGLTLNKYVEGETVIEGDAMMNLWNARSTDFAFGANLHDSEYAFQQSYSNFFFFITGFHGFHLFSGVIINIVVFFMVLNRVMERRKHYEMVEKVGLYWHFVDLVWVFVFTFFYLI